MTHKEASKNRQLIDTRSEDSVLAVMRGFCVFDPTYETDDLMNIATKDKAKDSIRDYLLSAENVGQKQLGMFVKDRFIANEESGNPNIPLRHTLEKH